MEGVLYKWTNYMTGWQPRWFVLDDGIISYYDSQDDVCKGSKGSIKMSVCEIKVHPTDNNRLELIIPGEQHFYVKAVNAAERQKWLVALGSSKAGLADMRANKEKEITETTESLKTKMSELRLYCDLLMQQVHTIQESVGQEDQEGDHSNSSSETLNEASSLLSATCNTFIKTLEECMNMANSKFKTDMVLLNPPDDMMMSPVSPIQMARMKRSISYPGTYNFDRSGLPPKEGVLSGQRSTQRRTRTCSDTEAHSESCVYEMDRTAVLCLNASVNGDSSHSISEECGAISPTSPRAMSDTPDTDLSI
ncbi:pleckstrin homology domain-containing family A member 3 isoform X1 [Salmo salar]|uniref:Pleckstrin homology domain-containing family A member 3 isoform X1 n=1 Tax=Salmo salar TaxID=8030 RepID=A0A1S3MUH6_SALSA|nr:pleckstrin homology domain-containing family A member 3-like isoform X1 [Salmo salar]|eukprot:XP_014006827.1 PREDICTED: pleckstrin homology domain-containing family A member 3-like isoform X1 [Salmo salar]